MTNDNVNHPKHYTDDPSGVECIEITRHRNFNIGNAIKYLWRAGRKEDAALDRKEKNIEDLRKAIFYIKDEIKRLGGQVETATASSTTSISRKKDPADGVYLVMENGEIIRYVDGETNADTIKCISIGLKIGNRALTISLKDAANGEKITLVDGEDTTDENKYYREECIDASADWNGKANTEHLKRVGLNKKIELKPGQWLPSLGELKFIQLFRKEINQALAYVGGDILAEGWYWSSTEGSATTAWLLGLYNGIACAWGTKATYQCRVRPVSAFIV